MAKKWSFIPTSGQSREELERICPAGEYRVLPPSGLPGVVPSGLLAKGDSVLGVSSGSSQGTTLVMVNVHRVDGRAAAIDQEPFGTVFNGATAAASGCVLPHGGWSGRTTAPPQEFWD